MANDDSWTSPRQLTSSPKGRRVAELRRKFEEQPDQTYRYKKPAPTQQQSSGNKSRGASNIPGPSDEVPQNQQPASTPEQAVGGNSSVGSTTPVCSFEESPQQNRGVAELPEGDEDIWDFQWRDPLSYTKNVFESSRRDGFEFDQPVDYEEPLGEGLREEEKEDLDDSYGFDDDIVMYAGYEMNKPEAEELKRQDDMHIYWCEKYGKECDIETEEIDYDYTSQYVPEPSPRPDMADDAIVLYWGKEMKKSDAERRKKKDDLHIFFCEEMDRDYFDSQEIEYDYFSKDQEEAGASQGTKGKGKKGKKAKKEKPLKSLNSTGIQLVLRIGISQ